VAEVGCMTEKTLRSQPATISFRWLAAGRWMAYQDHLPDPKSWNFEGGAREINEQM